MCVCVIVFFCSLAKPYQFWFKVKPNIHLCLRNMSFYIFFSVTMVFASAVRYENVDMQIQADVITSPSQDVRKGVEGLALCLF